MHSLKLQVIAIESEEVIKSSSLKKAIREAKKHAIRAGKVLNLNKPLTISIYAKAAWVIPSTGETGYTPSADWVQITLDLTGKTHAIDTVIEKRLPATVYHEVNHAKRWSTTGFGSTFREELVSEGLACAFEIERFDHDIPPLFLATDEEIADLLKIVESNRERMATSYNYHEWFVQGSEHIPKWLGYKLGYYIVKKVLKDNPGLKVADLMDRPAEDILLLSKVTI